MANRNVYRNVVIDTDNERQMLDDCSGITTNQTRHRIGVCSGPATRRHNLPGSSWGRGRHQQYFHEGATLPGWSGADSGERYRNPHNGKYALSDAQVAAAHSSDDWRLNRMRNRSRAQ